MPWVRIDEEFPHHPKVVGVGPLGIAMQVVGLCYCNHYLTDGFIPSSAIPTFMDFTELDDKAFNGMGGVCWIAVGKLVDAGIWEKVDGGYQIHDYGHYQPLREQVLKEREANKTRQERFRGKQQSNAVSSKTETPLLTPVSQVANTRPVPVPVPVPVPNTTAAPPIIPQKVKDIKRKKPSLTSMASGLALYEALTEDEKSSIMVRFPGVDLVWEAGKCVAWHMDRGGSGNWKLAFKNWLDRVRKEPDDAKPGGHSETNDYKPSVWDIEAQRVAEP